MKKPIRVSRAFKTMAVSTKRDSDLSFFEATTPHFFKIVLDDTIRHKKLGIPKKFVRKYGNNLPDSVVLRVPSGDIWRMELIKCNGEIWLHKGWQEFMEFYSVVYGSFLVFQYDHNNRHFNVIILDTSATEIDYPCRHNGENGVPINLEEDFVEAINDQVESNSSVEILSGFSLNRKRKEKSPLSSARPFKKIMLENPTRENEAKRGSGGMCIVAETQPLTGDEKANVLNRARAAFKSKGPSFMVVMQPSYIHPGVQLRIPASFVDKHFNEKCGDLILSVMDGRTWSVKYKNVKTNGRASAKLYDGWKKFMHDNHLEVGDVCAFELISSKETMLRVSMDRNMKDANSCPSSGNNKELKHEKWSGVCKQLTKGTNNKAANKLSSSPSPFFKVVIKPGHLKGIPLYVPLEFMAKHTKQSRGMVTLQVKNRRWEVNLISYPSRGVLSAGWVAFARENSLKAGDACIFKLINAESMLLEVSILRTQS